MKQHSENKARYFLPVRTLTALIIILSVTGITASGFKDKNNVVINASTENIDKDSIESVKAFSTVYQVLMSPRCMNCHPSGNVPLQGDDSHLHTMLPKRGTDGKGIYAMKCTNCHQPQNTPGLNTPPGDPNWHLPPANMKMVFQGKTPRQLAAQMLNPKRSGSKTIAQLVKHISSDALVLWGWNPGEGRTLPPLSHDEFVKQFKLWLDNGAYLPEK